MSLKVHSTIQRTKHLSKEALKTVQNSENEQCQFKKYVDASSEFSTAEKAAIRLDTIAEFTAFWAQANSSKNQFHGSHENGVGLQAKRYQNSAAVVSGFMENFSPILDIVKSFAAPYGGMAIGVISILFAVAKNKNETEGLLQSTISSIKDRLSGLKVYQRIYNDDHELDELLQTKIVAAYQSFIHFSIAATKYYKNGGPRRWIRALGPSAGLRDKANDVRDTVAEIRWLCEELLSKNIDEIKQINIGQTKRIHDLEAQLEEMQIRDDNNRVREVQRLLNLDTFSEEAQLKEFEKYCLALDSDEHLNSRYFQQMRGTELDRFRRQSDYQRWNRSQKPCLLILSGCNNESIGYIDECWMSPVATSMIEFLGQESGYAIYAYDILPRPGKLLYDVIPTIVLQLLRQKTRVLRDEKQFGELCSELQKFQDIWKLGSDNMDEDQMIVALQTVALRVVNIFDESEPIYIILDRVDRCRDWKRIDHRQILLNCLAKLVEGARCNLKVLAVINAQGWPARRYEDIIGKSVKDKIIIHEAEQGYKTDETII